MGGETGSGGTVVHSRRISGNYFFGSAAARGSTGVAAERRASHTFSVLSSLPLTIRRPSRLNATRETESVCPLSVSVSGPLWAFHTFSVLSKLPLSIRRPSGSKASCYVKVRKRNKTPCFKGLRREKNLL